MQTAAWVGAIEDGLSALLTIEVCHLQLLSPLGELTSSRTISLYLKSIELRKRDLKLLKLLLKQIRNCQSIIQSRCRAQCRSVDYLFDCNVQAKGARLLHRIRFAINTPI